MLRAGQGEVGHAPDEKFDASSMRREPLRRKSNFFNQINLIWAVQSLPKNISVFQNPNHIYIPRHPVPPRGVS
jgi:hypothetical protein